MPIRHFLLTLACLVAACHFLSSPAAGDDPAGVWTVSAADARKTAADEGKDIFMEFTGSDWCPPCKALHSNVLSKEVFLTGVPKNFVLLKLDSPRDKSKQTADEIEQYKQLSADYNVTGVPTIILADADMKPYFRMVGYGGDEAEAYVQTLTEKTSIRKERDALLAQAKNAEGAARAELLDKAVSGIESELVLAYYGDLVEEIVALDNTDRAGLKTKYEAKLRVAKVKARLEEIQRSAGGDVEGALASLDALVEELKPEGEALQEVLYVKGALLYRGDKNKSREALEAARKLAPESDLGKRITQILETAFQDQ